MSTLSGMQLEHKTMAECILLSVFWFYVWGFVAFVFVFTYMVQLVPKPLSGMICSVLTWYLQLSNNSCLKKQSNYRAMSIHTFQHKGLGSIALHEQKH